MHPRDYQCFVVWYPETSVVGVFVLNREVAHEVSHTYKFLYVCTHRYVYLRALFITALVCAAFFQAERSRAGRVLALSRPLPQSVFLLCEDRAFLQFY